MLIVVLITRPLSTGTLDSLQNFLYPPGADFGKQGGVFALGPEGNRLSKLQCIGLRNQAVDLRGWGYGGVLILGN